MLHGLFCELTRSKKLKLVHPGVMRIINVSIYFQAGYRAVLEMTKTSNTLPNEDHFHYYSSYPAFEDAMSKQGNQCLRRFVSKHFHSPFALIKLSL
jgi:hypothetical protein